MAELLAVHFNTISAEFDPLEPHLAAISIAGRIRVICKLKSIVRGYIFPALFAKFGALLAAQLCLIYNQENTDLACYMETGVCDHNPKEDSTGEYQ